MNDIIFNWLKGFPGMAMLQRQQVEAVPGGCGLFFRGITVKERTSDLLGGVRCRKQLHFRLNRYGDPLESAVFFLLLANWVAESAPALGAEQTSTLENARCIRDTGGDLALWEADLEITYWEAL
jgi:hypothetical protein